MGEKAGIKIPLTKYVARHTYSTVLKRAGVSASVISEQLGHSDEKTTQIYFYPPDSNRLTFDLSKAENH